MCAFLHKLHDSTGEKGIWTQHAPELTDTHEMHITAVSQIAETMICIQILLLSIITSRTGKVFISDA